MTKKERLEIYLKYKGLKPAAFARALHVSGSHLSEIDARKKNSTLYNAIRSKTEFSDCNIDWLETGEGEMLCRKESLHPCEVNESPANHSFRAAELPTMVVTQISRPATPDEQELLGYYALLGVEQRVALLSVAKAMAGGLSGKLPTSDPAAKDLTKKRSA